MRFVNDNIAPMNKTELISVKHAKPFESGEMVIRLSGISKKYNLYNKKQDRLKEALDPWRKKYHREFYALKDINLEIERGEVLGIVGKNGSGKSTLLKIISGILIPTTGYVEVKGNVVPLLELGAGFNPEFTGIENIYFYCSLLGYTREQTDKIFDGIINFAELGDYIYQPLKTYSSGMRARLAFAVSINVDPDILILDEVLAVGDELFRRKCYARMEEFFKGGKTILFVSHDANSINQLCTRAILLDKGENILDGHAKLVTTYYQKMLYAVNGNAEDVRKEIIELGKNKILKNDECQGALIGKNNTKAKALNINGQDAKRILTDGQENNAILKQKADYIPGLKPKTTTEYKNYDVDIFDVQITTLEGEKVNCLVTGDKYIYEYTVRFGIDVEGVFFGMQIKTEKGLLLVAANYPDDTEEETEIKQNNYKAGDVIKVKWFFSNNILQGMYYTNCGVTAGGGKKYFLNRLVDAYVFKNIVDRKKMLQG